VNDRPEPTDRPTTDRPDSTDRPATGRPTTRGRLATRRLRSAALTALFALAAVGSAACGTGAEAGDASADASRTLSGAPTAETSPSTTADEVPAATGARTVRSATDLAVHADPAAAEPVRVLAPTTEFGSALALLVIDVGDGDRAGWYEVLLPGRPNGATGWVRATDVTVHDLPFEVRVDLAARTLVVLEDGEPVLTTPVAVGAPDNPTPTGRFSLTDKLDTADPDGAYGPFALGLSGRSEVLTEFAGGDGQIGIHGTNDPASIGEAVSHGCLRVPNDVVATLSDMLPLGTPVTVA
jgi:lipoprotein-anchoring transpeptidase ErfK/SrfK